MSGRQVSALWPASPHFPSVEGCELREESDDDEGHMAKFLGLDKLPGRTEKAATGTEEQSSRSEDSTTGAEEQASPVMESNDDDASFLDKTTEGVANVSRDFVGLVWHVLLAGHTAEQQYTNTTPG